MHIKLTRTFALPHARRIELYRHHPKLGPAILFFSGGSALRKTSEELIYYTHNSIHLITPVDSGGSSAVLREAFRMPAIGDIRNRLMAMADRGISGNPEIFRLFAFRFSTNESIPKLQAQLRLMAEDRHPMVQRVRDPMRNIIEHYLHVFLDAAPPDFDLRGASIGNLILTGGYLDTGRQLDPVIYIFSKLANVRGIVRPIINDDLHLVAELADGKRIVGQHLLTGKSVAPIDRKIERIFLSRDRANPVSEPARISDKMRERIMEADLICYPIGSFYSSLITNLLPIGVSEAIRHNPYSKVFIPNTGHDPELFGISIDDQVDILLRYLKQNAPNGSVDTDFLNLIVVDERNGVYTGHLDKARWRRRGVEVINCRLISMRSRQYIDEKLLVPVLLSLA